MKVIFIKHHMEWDPGAEVDLEEGIANYLLQMGVVTTEETNNDMVEKVLVKKLKEVKPKPKAAKKAKPKGRPKKAI